MNKPDKGSKNSIRTDKWDDKIRGSIEDQMREFVIATKDLESVTPTAIEAMQDAFLALYKVKPHVKDNNEMRASYKINNAVLKELHGMKDYEDLHNTVMGDAIGAGLSSVSMEPELENLFRKMQDEVEQSEQIEKMLQEQEAGEGAMNALKEQLEAGEGDEDTQDKLDALQDGLDQLDQNIQDASDNLDDSLEQKAPLIAKGLSDAVKDAQEEAQAMSDAQGWGLHGGSFQQVDPQVRMELAKKLQSPAFKKMAEIFGRLQRVAFRAQTTTIPTVPEEVYDITMGNDMAKILPTELMLMDDEVMQYDFFRKFCEESLMIYDLKGDDEVSQGPIIVLEDCSASMSGDRSIWAKGIALALLKIAAMQNRGFTVIQFAGAGQRRIWDFDTSGDVVKLTRDDIVLEGFNAILAYAESSMSGGTDFMGPLGDALEVMNKEFDESGSTKSDIVFITDGEANVTDTFKENWESESERLEFSTYGIAIAQSYFKTLESLCTKVTGLKELNDPQKLASIFKEI